MRISGIIWTANTIDLMFYTKHTMLLLNFHSWLQRQFGLLKLCKTGAKHYLTMQTEQGIAKHRCCWVSNAVYIWQVNSWLQAWQTKYLNPAANIRIKSTNIYTHFWLVVHGLIKYWHIGRSRKANATVAKTEIDTSKAW